MNSRTSLSRSACVVGGFVIAAHAPLLAVYAQNLWQYRPHYEFFPFVVAAVAYLFWRRWPERSTSTRWTRYLEIGLLLVAWPMLAAAVVFYSPWLAAVAFVLAAGSWMLHAGGREAVVHWLPVWALLWLIVPPPFRLDFKLIEAMQRATTSCSSAVLDTLGVMHVRAGNVLEIPGRELFVAEACSGTNSQLVVVACAAIYAVLLRRSWPHGLLLVASGFVWAALLNMARVSSIVVLLATWQVDLSSGWQHETIGFFLSAIGLLLVVGTDQLLCVLLGPIDLREPLDVNASELPTENRLSRIWNATVASFPPRGPTVSSAPLGTVGVPGSRIWCSFLLAAGFVCLGAVQLAAMRVPEATPRDLLNAEVTINVDLDVPAASMGWQLTAQESERRERDSDQGQFSQIWKFHKDNRRAFLSIDYPFLGWHDLTLCFQSRGWQIDSRRIVEPEEGQESEGSLVAVEMSTPTGNQGLLFYSLYDISARPLEPRSADRMPGWRAKIASNPLLPAIAQWTPGPFGEELRQLAETPQDDPNTTTIQVQLFFPTWHDATPEEQDQALALFRTLRRQVRQAWMAQVGGPSS